MMKTELKNKGVRARSARHGVIAACALMLLGTQALASNAETLPEERRGVVIGGIIGAGVGGPIGAGVGAIVGGALIGKSMGLARVNEELSEEVAVTEAKSERATAELKAKVAYLNRALSESRAAEAVAKAAPEVPIQFKTGSSEIESHYEDRLAEIADTMARRPDARVTLSGFADRRGDDDYNLRLSESRVNEVKQFLIGHGVDESQIEMRAYGETKPVTVEENPESYFFDRRVVMQFSIESNETPLAVR